MNPGRFLLRLGIFFGLAAAAAAAVVSPRVVENVGRLVILKTELQPGDRSAAADTRFDRVDVVVTGEPTLEGRGRVSPGWAAFSRAGENPGAFVNTGTAPVELVRVELIGPIQGTTVPPHLPPGVIPPNHARLVTDHVVPAVTVFKNDRVRIVRWIFQPGDCSPIHIHAVDHVWIVIRGSRIKEIVGDGSSDVVDQPTGEAAYSRARGKIHSFGNVGDTLYEMVSIDVK